MSVIEKLSARRKAAAKGHSDAARALRELRDLGARLRAERDDLADRPVPLAEAQDGAARCILRDVEKIVGDLNLSSLTKPSDGRQPYLDLTDAQRANLAYAAQAETISAMIGARLADRYAEVGLQGISEDERAAQIARIDSDLLAAELAEEATIREMERGGAGPLRRPDADERALLAHDSELS